MFRSLKSAILISLITLLLIILLIGGFFIYQYRQAIKEKIFINENEEFSNSVEMWNKKDSFLDKQVTLEGRGDIARKFCTEMGCSLFNPCCNTCSGELGLRINKDTVVPIYGSKTQDGRYGLYNGREVGCSGNTCYMGCYPLEKGKKYKVTGIFKKGFVGFPIKQEGYYLELNNFEPF